MKKGACSPFADAGKACDHLQQILARGTFPNHIHFPENISGQSTSPWHSPKQLKRACTHNNLFLLLEYRAMPKLCEWRKGLHTKTPMLDPGSMPRTIPAPRAVRIKGKMSFNLQNFPRLSMVYLGWH